MIQRFLKFTVRKDIPKKNKAINHKVLVQSMPFGAKIPFLAKYHKKKLIAFCLAMVIIWTYDLQKPIFRYIISMRSPMQIVYSMFAEEKKIPNTILQQNCKAVNLQPQNMKLLTDLFVTADKWLYFGVGRTYLYQIYKELGIIQTQEETRKFWVASGFYKERNQKAAGVGLVEYLNIFQEGLKHARKKNPSLDQSTFVKQFAQKFIQKAPFIMNWQKQFNKQRTKQFLKNMPGDNQKKKDAIIQIIRDSTRNHKSLLSEQQLQSKVKQLGLKGMNLTDKMLYWELKRTWDIIRVVSLDKKISHPLTTQMDKNNLIRDKNAMLADISESEKNIKQIQVNFHNLYQQDIF